MPNQERTFEADGKTYALRFTQNALYRLEKELGRPLSAALKSLGIVELQAMMWAGLEGARLKHRAEPWLPSDGRGTAARPVCDHPFTIDEAGEIIDGLGGVAAAATIIIDAWRAAMPTREGSAATDRGEEDPI